MHFEIKDTFHSRPENRSRICSNDGCFNGQPSEFFKWVRAHGGNFSDIKIVEPFNGECTGINIVDNKSKIDHRELLKKYIGHIGEVEGISFINPDNNEGAGVCGKSISPAEWEELVKLDTEVDKDYYNK